ncbi:Rv3654c family TadE-like protein [Antrihabitans stalactiti]|uniref:Pilus assembly protein TadE n=1 Tax=Antrihabitans stalactiti TaxID=2584121 RepID=A0A848KGM2_9NOCA|nr:Rv3654c family TadE-like protein [Antrihabitans stalactiti]NMN96858.1 pilus assembly protein TadE [Antrihabitans stalactiti]
MKRLADDHGVATVFASFVMLALLVVAVSIVQVGSSVAARHRAQSAADLAALAAAGALDDGDESACSAAETIAHRMSVSVATCMVEDWDVVVTVTATKELAAFGSKEVRAVARAGPVE